MKSKIVFKENGLTILEVLVAMLILSMSLLVLLNMAMVALDGNDWSNKTTTAIQVMQEKLEQLRNIPTLSPSESGSDTTNGVYREWIISYADNHLKQVDVNVTYKNIRGNTVSNSITSYVKTDSI